MLYRQQLLFAMDFTASDPAKLTNILLRSINLIYIELHKKLLLNAKKNPPLNSVIERDESYSGPAVSAVKTQHLS